MVVPENLAFGNVPNGQTVERTVTLHDNTTTAIAGSVTFSAPGYSIVGDPSYSLATSASREFTIRVASSSVFPYWATMFTGEGESGFLERCRDRFQSQPWFSGGADRCCSNLGSLAVSSYHDPGLIRSCQLGS